MSPSGDELIGKDNSLKITKITTPLARERTNSQISKTRKVELKQEHESITSSSNDGHKTPPSPLIPDKSHLNVKLPPVMQSTPHDTNQPSGISP